MVNKFNYNYNHVTIIRNKIILFSGNYKILLKIELQTLIRQ